MRPLPTIDRAFVAILNMRRSAVELVEPPESGVIVSQIRYGAFDPEPVNKLVDVAGRIERASSRRKP